VECVEWTRSSHIEGSSSPFCGKNQQAVGRQLEGVVVVRLHGADVRSDPPSIIGTANRNGLSDRACALPMWLTEGNHPARLTARTRHRREADLNIF
jgi:hypothetical protein